MGRLTNEILSAIIERKNNGEGVPDLAREYDVSESNVYKRIRKLNSSIDDLTNYSELSISAKTTITFTLDNHVITINKSDLKEFLGALND